jgi:hypothetical protein
MHPVLLDIIEQFRAAQDRGVAAVVQVLGPTLGVRLPVSNRDWVHICEEIGLYSIRWINGIGIYAHGFGIEVAFRDLTIDFDWGKSGQPDGFDVWRLWNFIAVNQLNVPCISDSQLESWIQQAFQSGELIQDLLCSLYYSPAHRAANKLANQSVAVPESFSVGDRVTMIPHDDWTRDATATVTSSGRQRKNERGEICVEYFIDFDDWQSIRLEAMEAEPEFRCAGTTVDEQFLRKIE